METGTNDVGHLIFCMAVRELYGWGGPLEYGRTGYRDGRDGEVLRGSHCEYYEPALELKDPSDK
jgi:hypothetical protein